MMPRLPHPLAALARPLCGAIFALCVLAACGGEEQPAPGSQAAAVSRPASSPAATPAPPGPTGDASPDSAIAEGTLLFYDRLENSLVEVTGWDGDAPEFRLVWTYWTEENTPWGMRPVPSADAWRRTEDGGVLVASATEVTASFTGSEPGMIFTPRLLRPRPDGGGFDQVVDAIPLRRRPDEEAPPLAATAREVLDAPVPTIPPGYQPVPHAWMPVRDARLAGVLAQLAARDPAARPALAGILHDHPDDPLVLLLSLDQLLLAHDPVRLRNVLSGPGAALAASGDRFLTLAADYYALWLDMDRASREGRNLAVGRGEEGGLLDLAIRGRRGVPRPGMVHFNLDRPVAWRTDSSVPNFLGGQVAAKVNEVEAVFRLMDGRPDEALALAERTAWTAVALVGTDVDMISHLIGVALASIAARSMELVFLDGCRTPAQIEALWPRLDALVAAMREAADAPVVRTHGESSPLGRRLATPANEVEARTRLLHALARLAALRTATAARHAYMLGAAFPDSPSRIGPLLPAGADTDPFAAPGVTLRTTRGPDGAFVVYSVGPDGTDDLAAVAYDPTNGTASGGDIAVRVYGIPRHPFPSPGGLPATRDGILATFHHGLPADPFADTRGAGLAVSDTLPPVIWSLGPDTDESEWVRRPDVPPGETPPQGVAVSRRGTTVRYLENRPPEPGYDPTNGTISNGNLYWRVGYPAR